MDQDQLVDMSTQLTEVRRQMRAKILASTDPDISSLYYRSITMSEHEAARRAAESLQRQTDKYGLALMMIREGVTDPAALARDTLEKFGK